MVFNKFELEILLNAVRKERELTEKDYIMSIKTQLEKNKDNNNYECVRFGVGETSKNLQVINGLLIKLEEEIEKKIH